MVAPQAGDVVGEGCESRPSWGCSPGMSPTTPALRPRGSELSLWSVQ